MQDSPNSTEPSLSTGEFPDDSFSDEPFEQITSSRASSNQIKPPEPTLPGQGDACSHLSDNELADASLGLGFPHSTNFGQRVSIQENSIRPLPVRLEPVRPATDSIYDSNMVPKRFNLVQSLDVPTGGQLSTNAEIEHRSHNSTELNQPIHPLWKRCVHLLQKNLDSQVFTAYIQPLKLVSWAVDNSEIIISAPSKFLCTHIDRTLRGRFVEMLSNELGIRSFSLRFTVDQESSHEADHAASIKAPYVVVKRLPQKSDIPVPRAQSTPDRPSDINSRYTFDNFVVGNNNQFCHAAAMSVAETPGQSYNPLFIYGGVGLGKTHILHAIGNAVLARKPSAKILYVSSETFTNELILALRNAKMEEFKERMRAIEVLLVDDIQFMAGKERTQEEFFHTFNALYNAKHQIVITSDKIPLEIPGIEERLHTRFSWGLTANIQAPDFETRVAIINRKAAHDCFLIPGEVAHFLAENISSNVRELEGALTRLHAISSLQRKEINIESARSALAPLIQCRAVAVSVEDIKKAVATHFGIKVSEIISKRRTKNLSFPRHIAMYLCRKHTTASYPEIGSKFGGRDHTSVIHAASVVLTKVQTDPSVSHIVQDIEKKMMG